MFTKLRIKELLQRPFLFWMVFSISYSLLGFLAATIESAPFGDVTYVYRYWVAMAAGGQGIVGIDSPWVYPIGAFVPMGIAAILGGAEFYVAGWFALVVMTNLLTLMILRRATYLGARRIVASWLYVLFALCLGPISVSRLDSLVTPLLLLGLVWALRFPILSSVVLTAATWIKVWPAALLATAIIFLKKRLSIALTAAGMSLAIVIIALVLGAGSNIYSFLSQQTSRGLQIESLTATPYLWLAKFSPQTANVYFDYEIVTYQVSGPGVEFLTSLTTVLLGTLVIAVMVIGLIKYKAGASSIEIFITASMSIVAILLTFNKVGSPQFIFSLAAPILASYIFSMRSSKQLVWLGLVIALLTSLIFPYCYEGVLTLHPLMLIVLTLRNILLLALVMVSVVQLVQIKTAQRTMVNA